MKDAAHNVLNLTVKTIPTLSKSNRREIVKAAMVVRKARGSVERDRRTKEPLYPAHPEAPSRLTQQLCALAQGIAIAREHKVVKPKDIFLAQKIALDSATANRIKTLKILLEEGKVTADLLSEHLDISRSAARIWLHDMEILELLDHVGKKHSKNQRWWLKEEYVELLHKVWNANNADEGRC
jgi:histone H3/H4